MVTGAEATIVIGTLTLLGGGGGFLYRRDDKHKARLEGEIEKNKAAIDELDTGFGKMAQRLFGHPKDDSDDGALTSRASRMEDAEEDIDSLSDEVQYAKEAAEENGELIGELAKRQNEHALQTHQALKRIEQQLDETLIPDDDDFLRGGGEGGS